MQIKRAFVISGNTSDSADDVLDHLRLLEGDAEFEIESAAVISKDAQGNINVDDKNDIQAGEGALAGAVAGAIVGALLGAVPGAIVGATAGAATGGLGAAVIDFNLSQDILHGIGQQLKPNSSMLVVAVDPIHTYALESSLISAFGSGMVHERLDISHEALTD